MRLKMKKLLHIFFYGILLLLSCQKEAGFSNLSFTVGGESVSSYGGDVTVKFDVAGSWQAELILLNGEEGWAELDTRKSSGDAGSGLVRVFFDQNETAEPRVAELWLKVTGYDREKLCVFRQQADQGSGDATISLQLNSFMDATLKQNYLWAEEYKALDVEMDVNYSDFLYTNLLKLDPVNKDDGGYYGDHMSNSGQRYLYTSLTEVTPSTKAYSMASLGFGPFCSTLTSQDAETVFIAPGFVRPGSPAERAGMRRGDLIYSINGKMLTVDNFAAFMQALSSAGSGTYTIEYLRYNADGTGTPVAQEPVTISAGIYEYTPVLYKTCFIHEDKKIGYLVYESFDAGCQEQLKSAVNYFRDENITDLILDLRFNSGGNVAQSRWLSGCIAGETNYSKTFAKLVYPDGDNETWTFRHGYNADTDNLGLPIDMNLSSLHVICSYLTASAAELVISSLKGIDFPVYMYGGKTEGKNVGMIVFPKTIGGRTFEFSPVCFYIENAKGFKDYSNGFVPDHCVNNDNGSGADDADNTFPYSFSDWDSMYFNVALQWAYSEITGTDRLKNPLAAASSEKSLPVVVQAPVASSPFRCGTRLYR